MAGGSGERFWPLSRTRKPKQLLKLSGDRTMIEDSIARIAPLIPVEDVFIITSQVLLEPLRLALLDMPAENIIAEPYKRNTAPCLALAASFIAEKYSEDYKTSEISIAVLTADQNIEPELGFVNTVSAALNYVEEFPALATIGITPSRPETGYGYIEVADNFSDSMDIAEIKTVKRFIEKPDSTAATQFLKDGNKLWNSGMFFWRLDTFISAMKEHLPEVGNQIEEMQRLYKGKTNQAMPEAFSRTAPIFEAFPNISIDFGLMEKADKVVVAKALFNWDDIGSWDSLQRVRKADADGNIIEGRTALIDAKDTIVINTSADDKIVVAGIGLEGMVVVVTDDSVMICPKDRVQEVKKCVEHLRTNKGEKWL